MSEREGGRESGWLSEREGVRESGWLSEREGVSVREGETHDPGIPSDYKRQSAPDGAWALSRAWYTAHMHGMRYP